MQKLASQIHSFVSKNIHLELILNPKDFPESPFDYLFYPSKSLAIHCVSFETLIDNPAFFQKIGLSLAQKTSKSYISGKIFGRINEPSLSRD